MAVNQERYLIGPRLRDKLRDMVSASDGAPIGRGGDGKIPVIHQWLAAAGGGSMILGTFSGAWPNEPFPLDGDGIGSNVKSVTVMARDPEAQSQEIWKWVSTGTIVTAVNLMAYVPASVCDNTKFCLLTQVSGVWLLAAAEC